MAAGKMKQLAASAGVFNSANQLTGVNAFGKAVILNGGIKKIYDPTNAKLSTAAIGTHPPDFKTVLTGGTSNATMVVDYITSLSGACVIYGLKTGDTSLAFVNGETVTGLDDDGNSVSFVLNANEVLPSDVPGGHLYDFTVFGQDSSFGTLPATAYLSALYLGRLYIGGDPDNPYQWYASAQRNIFNWKYTAGDVSSAIRGGDTDIGDLQDIPRAFIQYGISYLLFGCSHSIYIMINDPAQGGTLRKLSQDIGVFGSRSYCWDENGFLYFVGTGGVYRLSPDGGEIKHLTEFVLPSFISDESADPSTHRITMEYDFDKHGMQIAVVTLADSTNSCYWYERRTDGFFEEVYPNVCSPYSMLFYESQTSSLRGMLYGCGDGYVRTPDSSETDDDTGATTAAIDSHVTLGPFALNEKLGHEGIVSGIHGILSGGASGGSESDSSDVSWYIYVGDSPEEVLEKVAADTHSLNGTLYGPGYIKGGKSLKSVRGRYAAIKLRNNTAGETWGFEELEVNIRPVGRL
jgi:hypothetical protein